MSASIRLHIDSDNGAKPHKIRMGVGIYSQTIYMILIYLYIISQQLLTIIFSSWHITRKRKGAYGKHITGYERMLLVPAADE
jgi:hypothetical protein